MAKDPAFLFYPNDWLGGTLGMTFEEKGAYIELLMLQFNRGHMTEHMIGHSIGQLWDNIKDKFEQDENGKWFNKRLDEEKNKRKKFTESRRNNQKGINQFSKKEKKQLGHMTKHMENENVNEDENINLNESEEKTIQFICKEFEISEINHPQNYFQVVKCVKNQSIKGDTLWKHFKDQCWNYFLYKKLAKEKLHGLKSFLGTGENKFDDGGWNADNWIKKHLDLKKETEQVESNIYPAEEKKGKVYPGKIREKTEPNLLKVIKENAEKAT